MFLAKCSIYANIRSMSLAVVAFPVNRLTRTSKDVIERIFNACIRYQYGIQRTEGTLAHNILRCNLFDYLDYRQFRFVRRLLTLQDNLHTYSNRSIYPSRYEQEILQYQCTKPRINTIGNLSFRVPLLWNSLLYSVK